MTTITIDRSTIEQALDALDKVAGAMPLPVADNVRRDIRAALAAQPERKQVTCCAACGWESSFTSPTYYDQSLPRNQAMTSREAFEDWYEVDCYPCEHSNWFRLDSDGDYEFDEVQYAWRTWQAATAAALAAKPSMPAWHDADGSDLKEFVESLVALRERAATAAALERAAVAVEKIDKENWFAWQCAFSKHAAAAIRALKDET